MAMKKPRRPMPPEEHRQRHVFLHKALDELIADFAWHQPPEVSGIITQPIEALMKWSHQQTIEPTEPDDSPRKGQLQ